MIDNTCIPWILWDPSREIFTIPVLEWPIVWYSLFFAAGFIFGYLIFSKLLRRFLFNFPYFSSRDILNEKKFLKALKKGKTNAYLYLEKNISPNRPIQDLNKLLDNPKSAELLEEDQDLEIKKRFFSLKGVFSPLKLWTRFLIEKRLPSTFLSLDTKAHILTERLVVYVFFAILIGARLGHIFFYEDFSYYLHHPLKILALWEGGLASHGAALALFPAIFLYSLWAKKYCSSFTWVATFDLLSIPAALAGGLIRIGNFFNQEVLGKTSSVAWAVVFGHPIDGSLPAARHPVQLYESLFYFFTFALLLWLSYFPSIFTKKGRLIGIFCLLVFGFRFFVEFLKEPQSLLIAKGSLLTMGQMLSLPLIALGGLTLALSFFFKKKKELDNQL